MGFRSFGTGSVLRDSQVAPSNAQTTGTTQTGVVRDARPVPTAYTLHTFAPAFVDAAADQYRAAVIRGPGTTPTEYLVWSANTANLAGPANPDPTWWTEAGYGTIPPGTTTVGTYTDGSTSVLVTDNGCRDIGRIYAVVVARGDVTNYDDDGWKNPDDTDPADHGGQARNGSNPYMTLYFQELEQDSRLGIGYLTASHLVALGGGLSVQRGDTVIAVHYTINSARFWWSKNDRYEARFGWSPRSRRWEPFKGTTPQNLGMIKNDAIYKMVPAIRNLPLGSVLPGSTTADAYSMIRIGSGPGSLDSVAVLGIVVCPDNEIGTSFTTGTLGRMGQTNGKLDLNPTFVESNLGKLLWYVPNTFLAANDGIIGKMTDPALYIAPVPGLMETPLLRFGSRKYLTATMVENDAAVFEPAQGNVVVSATTGLLKFNHVDLAKADPKSGLFDKFFLGEDVIYDGVSLSGKEQPTRSPVQLLNAAGDPAVATDSALYIPAYVYLPTEFAADNTRRGLGISGVIDAPDGTGATPDQVGVLAALRPGGDNTGDTTTGRIRNIRDGVSDTIIFTQMGTVATIIVVDHESDIPASYTIPGGTAYVAREPGAHGSLVVLAASDVTKFGSKPVFFLQSAVTPATWTNVARVVSRNRNIFRFDGTEIFTFSIDGIPRTWISAPLVTANPTKTFFTTAEVVANIGVSHVKEVAERIVIESPSPIGSVEIGFGTSGIENLSGCIALGFVPGWRAVGGVDNWLVDSGVSLGMFRTPYDPDGSVGVADFRVTDRVDNLVLTSGIMANPFYFLNTVPLMDVAGIDEGVFFKLSTTVTDGDNVEIVDRPLEHYKDIIYRFGQRKFDWVEAQTVDGQVTTPTVTLNFGHAGIAPESFESAIGGGLYVSPDGGVANLLVRDTDYILPQNGTPGTGLLISRYLEIRGFGANGRTIEGSPVFTDIHADFVKLGVTAGDILLAHDRTYTITAVTDGTTLQVTPTPNDTETVTWEIHACEPDSVTNPALVADMSFIDFNHLPQETLAIRILTPVDATGKVNMTGALASGRPMSLRFGHAPATTGNTVTLYPLRQIELGFPVPGLQIPDTTGPSFAAGAFVLRAGPTDTYQPVGVTTFSTDPATVEYLTAATVDGPIGTLKFGSAFLALWSKTAIFYIETFLPATAILAGTAEYDPATGTVRASATDVSAHPGEVLYFVEQLITESRKDAAINPMLGSFSTNTPVAKGSLVEVSYWQADLEGRKVGNQITELLPVSVRNEVSALVRQNVYTFNTTLAHQIDQDVEPVVYIGPIRQNYGRLDYLVDFPSDLNGAGRITFVSHDVPDNVDVQVTYAVYDMAGGEKSFTSSKQPIYRPPFFIKAGQDRFGLRGDRTTEFVPGQMLRIGEECFYIKALTYYPQNAAGTGDVTAVYIFPPTIGEVGSRAPGNDVLTVITHGPITTVVDPDGTAPVMTSAPAGFMAEAPAGVLKYDPIVREQKTLVMYLDASQVAVPGRILEIGGVPYTIATAMADATGSRMSITVTSAFRTNLSMADNPTIKFSNRPVYPPDAIDFLGVGPILTTEPYAVFLMDSTAPGRVLARDVDYSIDPSSGNIHLPGCMAPTQKLVAEFTRLNTLTPYMKNGAVIVPRFEALFLSQVCPSESNGILNGTLVGTYTFASPDAFYFRAVPLLEFVGEVTKEITTEIANRQPASGALNFTQGSTKNWENGIWDLYGTRRHLMDKDRVARTYLEFYNNIIIPFEQVGETIAGGFVGDHDGKFHFWVGHDRSWLTPGYEDDVTGYLTTHIVWSDIVNQANPTAMFFGLLTDPIVMPTTIDVVAGRVTGSVVRANALDKFVCQQRDLVFNDVDDMVLLTIGSPTLTATTTAPYFTMAVEGQYAAMWDTHQLSRLFPTMTKAMIRTLPGIGSDQNATVYSAGILADGEDQSTTGSVIAQLRNPVIGDIKNVSSANLHKRRARARIWGWFPDGIPAVAFGMDITTPCIIAVPALLRDIPINPATGYPDISKFLSQGGTLADAKAGDPPLAIPGFVPGDQIAWGKPDGTVYPAYNRSNPITVFGTPTYTGIFVADVQYGCVITFKDASGATISDPAAIYAGIVSVTALPLGQGDTVFAGSPTQSFVVAPAFDFATFQTLTGGMDGYRDGFDVKVSPEGTLIDLSLPSSADGTYLSLKETFGQNAPHPLEALEGPVVFTLGNQTPLLIPALMGGIQDDSGDYQIPYLLSSNTEMDRFGEASIGLSDIYAVDDVSHAMYPDEILGTDGTVVTTVGVKPGLMTTVQSTSPVFGPGQGNFRVGDLLLNQVHTPNPFSADALMGIHAIGAVVSGAPSLIKLPRFVTPTLAPSSGSAITEAFDYIVENAMVYVDNNYPPTPQIGPPPNGVYVIEDVPNGVTILDFGTTTIALNDGQTVATGNLNYLFANGSRITIQLIARQDTAILNGPAGINPLPSTAPGGVVALTIDIIGGNVTITDYQGTVYGPVAAGAATFGDNVPPLGIILDNRQIRIPITGLIPWGPGAGTQAQWFLPYTVAAGPVNTMIYGFEYAITVDTWNGASSTTAWISSDRLTFNEVFDLSMAKKRGFVHPQSGLALETKLSVYQVTVGQTAASNVLSSINRYGNGMMDAVKPIPYTFVPESDPDTVGTWTARVGGVTERGQMTVMSFEGENNTPITGADATFVAIPSDERDTAGVIFEGTGKTSSDFSVLTSYATGRFDHRITEITPSAGLATHVQGGDILVIDKSANTSHPGTHQAGTYLVRHAVAAAAPGDPFLKVSPETFAGWESGWCPLHFPTVVSFDDVANELTMSDLAPAEMGPTYGGNPSGWATPAGSTRVYIIRNLDGLASADSGTFAYSMVSARYTAISGSAVFTLTDYKNAVGVGLTAAVFKTLLDKPYQVSGMTYWPINVSGAAYGLPDNNVVGFDSESALPVPALPWSNWAVYGFHLVSFIPQGALSTGVPLTWAGDKPVAPAPYVSTVPEIILKAAGTPSCIVPIPGTVVASYAFQTDTTKPVYPWVVRTLQVTDLTYAQWHDLNVIAGSAGFGNPGLDVACILPNTKLELHSGVTEGFYAQTGVFLEPTFPRSTVNLSTGHARVVDATHSLPDPTPQNDWDREVGMRDAVVYSTVAIPDEVTFHVRRIRRFHDVLETADKNLMPLRFAYEIRRGIITAYSGDNKQRGQVAAVGFTWIDGHTYTGTQLGGFATSDVNVNVGDMFRLLDADGNVLEEVRINAVTDDGNIVLDAPGLQTAVVVGNAFQVFLKRAPVPHEQSGEELLDIITDKRVARTIADWTLQQGGYVPDITGATVYADAVNRLYDDLNATTAGSFTAMGVKKGDIVVIDPAGTIPQVAGLPAIQEFGCRPIGDVGVSTRTDPGVYIPGTPSALDDNRGFYRVTAVHDTVTPPYLAVAPINTFAGTPTAPVTYAANPYAYAVYPTVDNSALMQTPYPDPGGSNRKESQMALRPTLFRDAVTKAFANRTDGFVGHSIRPFSYRIIRPTKMFSEGAIDLVLMMRERMLSLIELLKEATTGRKHGSYFVFQRDEHIKELGSLTDPDVGLGVPSNLFVEAIAGRTDVTPYANNSGALSILDRRVWVHDNRLDSLTKNADGGMKTFVPGPGLYAYTAYTDTVAGAKVLPVLPERIDEVLNTTDKFRMLRYLWLNYRTNKVLGTLAAIRNFDRTLPDQLADQARAIEAAKSTKDAT